MKGTTANLPAYLQIVNLWFQTMYAYRVELAMQLIGLLLKILLMKVVWTAVYAGRTTVDGVPLAEVISFITLANLQLWFMTSTVTGYLHERVRNGLIALDLARPTPFLGQLMAHQIGGTFALLPFMLVTVPLGLLVGGIQPPITLAAAVFYTVSLLFAYIISSLIGMLFGLITFWTTEVWGILTIFEFMSQFFSGALVPLWFFPPLLRAIGEWLPFQAQAYIPLAIYAGRISGDAVLGAIGLQFGWVIVLTFVVVVVWRRAMYRVVIQGG